jgi:hypothetical protein
LVLGDIAAIVELETKEDAIMIACLDNMSLEGDFPDYISDIEEVPEKALFTGS